jgi:hypothetical protein
VGKPTFTARAPHARERTLPNLDTIFYAAPFVGADHHGAGPARVQQIFDYAKGQVLYKPTACADAWFEMDFEVKEKEPVRLLLNMTRSYDFGRYQASLNGVSIGPVLNFYHEDPQNWEYHLLDFWPDPGRYVLRLECVGKDHRSTGFGLGIESVRLRERRPRVKQWAHDKDKDWRKKPILYN